MMVRTLPPAGPAGQIAIMHRELVDEKRWISEARFLHALNDCMLLLCLSWVYVVYGQLPAWAA